MKFNFTPARLVIIKKTRNNNCWQGWRERGTLILLVVLQTGIATVENSMEIPQKIKNRTTSRFSNFISRYLHEENKF